MIKINIDMPRCCNDCPCLHIWYGNGNYGENTYQDTAYCGVTSKDIATLDCGELETGVDIDKRRPDDCPLIEEE